MTTNYYSTSGSPGSNSTGASAAIRAQFAAVEAGFAKLPGLTGNALKVVRVNAAGTALEAVAASTITLPFLSIKDYGAIGDGVTNDYTAIASALAAATALGGGTVFAPPGTYAHSLTIVLPVNVRFEGYGAKLLFTGAGTQLQTAATGWTGYASMAGFEIAFGAATTALQLNSGYGCRFNDLIFTGTSYTNTLIRLACNTTGTLGPGSNRNCVFNGFGNILNEGICGTFIQLVGNGPMAGPATEVVTLNSFFNVSSDGPAGGCCVYGLDFNKWADSNSFTGMCRIILPAIAQAINAVGMIQNSAGATQSWGVYDNSFQHLAVDTFGTVGSDARRGVVLNFSSHTAIGMFYQTPLAIGGDLIVGTSCYSYEINKTYDASTNQLQKNFFGTSVGIGSGKSLSYSLYLTNFTLTGANPASINVADTFASGATQAAGITVDNSTQAAAWTLAAYYGLNLVNPTKGAGSAITDNVGIYIGDQTAGVNNYGINSQVSAGANKFNLYMAGTADNYFNGDLKILGLTAIPAGGTAGKGFKFSSTANFGLFFGSGAPTLAAGQGSIYLRSDGSSTSTRIYVNTDGSTAWTNITTAT